ncbi:hypothetical protein ACFWP7_07110 [Streptomyces sp. NPDC058470]|uniref:hypothetical protein n=1 Tax=Streptomyces sp. NPDC058470 TaxID=3346515 RepID=UPI00364C78BB
MDTISKQYEQDPHAKHHEHAKHDELDQRHEHDPKYQHDPQHPLHRQDQRGPQHQHHNYGNNLHQDGYEGGGAPWES